MRSMEQSDLEKVVSAVKWNSDGLVPAIAQDVETGEVLMLAYMNEEALVRTLRDKLACYYSRSRQSLWVKGETSGHYQHVLDIKLDCDRDAVLLLIRQDGAACHEGDYSCFHYGPTGEKTGTNPEKPALPLGRTLEFLAELIQKRRHELPEGSYTTYLFTKGIDKILKKVGEECAEVIIAAKNNSGDELRYETADLLYHLLVLLAERGVTLDEISAELEKRKK
nr:bifunctional phosphoribosyl-AMP cyclohydrolase/phosphoribosyl-ATP diphosphatase HisIE [Syntrophobotulus glycolicus]